MQRARQVLEEGSAATSRNGRALYLLAEAQRRTHDMAAAEATARKLIALDPKNLVGSRQLAQIFEDQHDYQKVVGVLEPIVTARFRAADAADMADPSFRGLYFDLVAAYEQLKQYDKALAVLTQARKLSPEDPMVDVRMARTQLDAGKGGNAVATLQAAIKKFPDEPSIKIELASAYEHQKKFADAESLFRTLISADPKNAEALNSLGYMLAERGQRLDESVGFVQRALALDPGNPAFLDSLGWALFKQGQIRCGGAAVARSQREAAVGLRDPGSLRRSAGPARRLSGGDRRVAARARWRRRLHHARRRGTQDQVGPPENRQEEITAHGCAAPLSPRSWPPPRSSRR